MILILGMITAIPLSFVVPSPSNPKVVWLPCEPPQATAITPQNKLWGRLKWQPDPAALSYVVYMTLPNASPVCLGTTGGKSLGEFPITGLSADRPMFQVRWIDGSGQLQFWDAVPLLDFSLQ